MRSRGESGSVLVTCRLWHQSDTPESGSQTIRRLTAQSTEPLRPLCLLISTGDGVDSYVTWLRRLEIDLKSRVGPSAVYFLPLPLCPIAPLHRHRKAISFTLFSHFTFSRGGRESTAPEDVWCTRLPLKKCKDTSTVRLKSCC